MITLLFTKSPKWGSRLIRWALNEPVSHVAVFIGGGVDLVVHSKFYGGVDIDTIKTFQKHNQILYQIDLPFSQKTYDELLSLEEKPYDYSAFLWLGWRAILRKLFGVKVPAIDPLNAKGCFICTEVANVVLYYLGCDVVPNATPMEIYKKMRVFKGIL